MNRRFLLGLWGAVILTTSPLPPVLAHEGHNHAFGGNAVSTTGQPKVAVDPVGQRAIGLQTRVVSPRSLSEELWVTGQVQAAENRAYDVTPRVAGTVGRVYAQQGDNVSVGRALASIHSVEVANALSQLLEDRARLQSELAGARVQYRGDVAVQTNEVELARAAYQREQALLNEGITARKDYLTAKNAYESAVVRLETLTRRATQEEALRRRQLALTLSAAKSRLRMLGLSDGAVNQALAQNRVAAEIPITSPASGIVTFRDVNPGETVEPGKRIFSIVNLSPVWVVVNVFQEQISKVRVGQSVRIKTPSGATVAGTLSNIGAVVDPERRTLPVRIVSDNGSGLLRPGMFVTANIVTGHGPGGRVVVPASALVEENARTVVYVKTGNDFQAVPVQVGRRASEEVEILDGIYEGDEVVVRGAKQLRAQTLVAASGAAEAEHGDEHRHDEETPRSQSLPPLFLGVLIGAGAMALGGAGWFYFIKRPSTGRN